MNNLFNQITKKMKTHKVLIGNNIYLASQKEMEELKELYDSFKKAEKEAGENYMAAYEEMQSLSNYKNWLSDREPLLKDVYQSDNLDYAHNLKTKKPRDEEMDDDLPF